jgi:small subunit ribosomal protein S18
MPVSSRGKQQKFKRRTPGVCSFCEHGVDPNYKDVKALEAMMTDKGKILSRQRTGNCQKHQRTLARAIKRARYVALVPYVTILK